ncbi:MAG: hypothetical protein KDA87_09910, partial [Planctomycetales bacterium]|nr:hypothetical protein [Planctomycetales bacterium]
MWAYIFRKLIYNIPIYLTIIFLVMVCLRVRDPAVMFLGKNATQEDLVVARQKVGLDRPLYVQYMRFLTTLDWNSESWRQPGRTVGDIIRSSVVPSVSLTLPALVLTSFISICVGLISAFFRGRAVDQTLVL